MPLEGSRNERAENNGGKKGKQKPKNEKTPTRSWASFSLVSLSFLARSNSAAQAAASIIGQPGFFAYYFTYAAHHSKLPEDAVPQGNSHKIFRQAFWRVGADDQVAFGADCFAHRSRRGVPHRDSGVPDDGAALIDDIDDQRRVVG